MQSQKNKNFRKKSAFSMVELLVVMTIISVMLGILAFRSTSWLDVVERNQAISDIMETIDYARQEAMGTSSDVYIAFTDTGNILGSAITDESRWYNNYAVFRLENTVVTKDDGTVDHYNGEFKALRDWRSLPDNYYWIDKGAASDSDKGEDLFTYFRDNPNNATKLKPQGFGDEASTNTYVDVPFPDVYDGTSSKETSGFYPYIRINKFGKVVFPSGDSVSDYLNIGFAKGTISGSTSNPEIDFDKKDSAGKIIANWIVINPQTSRPILED